ncbi:MAG TPA: DUF1326 domain-containing protein [Vicinamibacterales bacterium]|jgi:hypothetical protein|nr:DUF1326 domain-containing protein [Vicinamibacterales bacterium]
MVNEKPAWKLEGLVLVACNCDYGCPCNFNARPSHGKCEGGWTWHVERGAFDDVPLDGLNFSVYANWPGAIHEGNGEAVVLVDERADTRQRDAIATLVRGGVGGPWGTLAWTWPTIHGPMPVPYEVDFKGTGSRIKAGAVLEVESMTIRNPVTGAEVHPGVVLPEGIIVKQADLGCSKVFRVREGISMDHSGQYTAVGPFSYTFP